MSVEPRWGPVTRGMKGRRMTGDARYLSYMVRRSTGIRTSENLNMSYPQIESYAGDACSSAAENAVSLLVCTMRSTPRR